MKNLKFSLIFLLTAGVFFACQAPAGDADPIDMDALKAEIQAMEDAYAAASNSNDAEAQVAYYADDAVSMPDGEPAVVGKDAILERTKANMAKDTTGGSTASYEIMDVFAAGDMAVEIGKWNYTSAEGQTATGKFISVFEKRDGKYVCIRDIWNSDSDDDDREYSNVRMKKFNFR